MLESKKDYTREEIEAFLERETLKYQKIDLPYGLSTPGHERNQIKKILLSDDMTGQSVLDVGSFLGQMCIAALQGGAGRAVGFELNRDRIRQAEQIAEFLQLPTPPEYYRKDIESAELDEDFDNVLLLNILHHLRDPIGILRALTKRVKNRLIIESASLNRRDAKKLGVGALSRFMLSRNPTAYVGPCHPQKLSQTYFFSSQALHTLLSQHIMQFWRIDEYQSEFKGRFILDCRKLSIDRMILVAGCNSSGKSTFCEKVRQNEFSDTLEYEDYSKEVFVNPAKLWGKPLSAAFPKQRTSDCLMHYDISLVEKFGLHSFERDPATSLIECTKKIDAVLVAPTVETLKRQIFESEIESRRGKKSGFHREHMERFDEPRYLFNLYSDWLDFLEGLNIPTVIHIHREVGSERHLVRCQTMGEARAIIQEIYGA